MNKSEKQKKIKELVVDMLNKSHEAMLKKVDTALNSGAIDIDAWGEDAMPMILPKCIVTAILQLESTQHDGQGSSFERQIKKEVKNIRYFI